MRFNMKSGDNIKNLKRNLNFLHCRFDSSETMYWFERLLLYFILTDGDKMVKRNCMRVCFL